MPRDTSNPTRTSEFNYDLPKELIAQEPLPKRSQSRMMILRRGTETIEHRHISDLPEYLTAGDLLVVNDTRVIPARIFGRRSDTGGKVELLLIEETRPGIWDALYHASGRPRPGLLLSLADAKLEAEITGIGTEGRVSVKFSSARPVLDVLEEEGLAPVPPYIKRESRRSPLTDLDHNRYQTVYARHPGAVAAPTAGLHFTDELLKKLEGRGVRFTTVTLHVGPGTFKPVKTELISDHTMESERYAVGDDAAEAINNARDTDGRIIAVGTTVVRTLETIASDKGIAVPGQGRTSLFIHPSYKFKAVDVMLTNFHLPMSSLIMMVSAFAGKDFVFRAYAEAIRERYRFYSYGDCMLIL